MGFLRAVPSGKATSLKILGAREHNLKNIDVEIPLNRLVCVTGVSGSGKSTLIQDVLYNALCKLKHKPDEPEGRHRAIVGHEKIEDVVMVDQSPIGRTTRSNPASYVGAFDTIRKLFAAETLAKERSYTAGTFSFNSGEGRCPTCGGNGFEHVEMQFLSDVYLRCPDCDGKRYRPEVLEVRIKGKSIADVLDMTANEACEFFAAHREVLRALEPLRAVGLGYMKLGQPVPTLSGGEAQRLKLAGHLVQTTNKRTLFLFDEPTTGLHFDDIATLLHALSQLIQRGHSVVVIEHNLDVIRAADWIIDLGPEGGDAGGEIICVGTPADVATLRPRSHGSRAARTVGTLESRRISRAVVRDGPKSFDLHPQRARAQPQKHRRQCSPRQVHRHHRHQRQRQKHTGIRHFVRRRPAPLSRIAERLCAPVRSTGLTPRRGRDLWDSTNRCHRTAHQPRRTQEHGRDRHGNLSFPAPAVREARHAILSRLQHPDPAADPRGDPRKADEGLSRPAHRIARAVNRGPQRLLHRSRRMGVAKGVRPVARRR